MTIAIVGAGATGGFLGAHLARSGQEVVLIGRGPHLAAMRARGITVRSREEEFTARPECSDEVAAVRGAKIVFLTLKAHSIAAIATPLAAALDDDATLVSAQNGIPWWYFEDRHLDSVDPGGRIAAALPRRRVVGCVVYPATSVVEPGVIEHLEGMRFSVGEPDGSRSDRVRAISAALVRAGLKAPVQTRIRSEIWLKVLGNATLNPVSALTRARLDEIVTGPATGPLVRRLMEEVAAVGVALGIEIPLGIDQRLEGAAATGDHRTSMLQDLEARRPLEVDALLGAVVELAGMESVPVPSLAAVYALTRLLDEVNRRAE